MAATIARASKPLKRPKVPAMKTLTQSRRRPVAEPIADLSGRRVCLPDVGWDQYVAIGNALTNRSALRITYDRGELEIMTLSPLHERYKQWLGRMVDVLAEEHRLTIAPFGSMTFQDELLRKGLEPDQCFWIAHESQVRLLSAWDPTRDPPPDLVIEIEISRSALDRMALYASLRVPEVWRFDGKVLRVCLLDANGNYHELKQSLAFPHLPIAQLVRFLEPDASTDYLTAMRKFRSWVRQHIAKKKPKSKE